MFWLPAVEALVAGDRLIGVPGIGLRLCPPTRDSIFDHNIAQALRAISATHAFWAIADQFAAYCDGGGFFLLGSKLIDPRLLATQAADFDALQFPRIQTGASLAARRR